MKNRFKILSGDRLLMPSWSHCVAPSKVPRQALTNFNTPIAWFDQFIKESPLTYFLKTIGWSEPHTEKHVYFRMLSEQSDRPFLVCGLPWSTLDHNPFQADFAQKECWWFLIYDGPGFAVVQFKSDESVVLLSDYDEDETAMNFLVIGLTWGLDLGELQPGPRANCLAALQRCYFST